MALFVNKTNKLANLRLKFKLEVMQVVDKLQASGYSLASYRQARSYKLTHGYYSLYFEGKGNTMLMLQCSNDEQTSLSLYTCLKLGKFLFCPCYQVFSCKSYGMHNKLKYLAILSNIANLIATKLDQFNSLLASLQGKELNAFQFNEVCKASVTYRNFKFKSDRHFHFIPDSNGYNLLVSLLTSLLSSKSHNNQYYGLIENMRQLTNISQFVINKIAQV